ncbi:MAG: radical SAM protein [Bacillota bacterium]
MRAVLINTPNASIRPGDEEENLGLGYLAAVLRQQGHEVTLMDGTLERLTPRAIRERLAHTEYQLAGVSILFQESIGQAAAVAAAVKAALPKALVVAGGQPATFLHRELLERYPVFDCIVMGEGEEAAGLLLAGTLDGIPGLAFRRDGQVVTTPRPPLVRSLDSLPFPARDLLPLASARNRAAQISRSRGCWGSCSFCSLRAFYGQAQGPSWRTRSAESVVAEIEALRSGYGIEAINFVDDNFIGPGQYGREQARRLAETLIAAGTGIRFYLACRADDVEEDLFYLLKRAGLSKVFLGIESGVQAVLDRFGKGTTVQHNLDALAVLRKLGIEPVVGYIMFDPDSTMEEFHASLAFLERAFGSWASVRRYVSLPLNVMEVYSGTPIAQRLQAEGRLRGDILGYTYHIPDLGVKTLVRLIQNTRRCAYPVRNWMLRRKLGKISNQGK